MTETTDSQRAAAVRVRAAQAAFNAAVEHAAAEGLTVSFGVSHETFKTAPPLNTLCKLVIEGPRDWNAGLPGERF